MTFPAIEQRIPTSIGNIRIELLDLVATTGLAGEEELPARKKAGFHVEVLDQNGRPIEDLARSGSLIPHLTPTQQANIEDFLDAMRAKAESEILP